MIKSKACGFYDFNCFSVVKEINEPENNQLTHRHGFQDEAQNILKGNPLIIRYKSYKGIIF